MTSFSIEQQRKTIKKASIKASKTKETALSFLRNAGLVKEDTTKPLSSAKIK